MFAATLVRSPSLVLLKP